MKSAFNCLLFALFAFIVTVANPAAAADEKPHARLVILYADNEYPNDQSLNEFAERHLKKDFDVEMIRWDKYDGHRFVGIERLKDAYLILISARRRMLPKEQLDVLRKWVADGKPVVGIRTASHAFAGKAGGKKPEGADEWPQFDQEVLGCHYDGHHPTPAKGTATTVLRIASSATENPILMGIPKEEFRSAGSLYKCSPLGPKATLLVEGSLAGKENVAAEPVAWTNVGPGGGRVFFTSLGHVQDFSEPAFVRLLRNGIYWAGGKEIPAEL
jgi:type 1 glutamine amidotransferase